MQIGVGFDAKSVAARNGGLKCDQLMAVPQFGRSQRGSEESVELERLPDFRERPSHIREARWKNKPQVRNI
jgi:hypothetical protein